MGAQRHGPNFKVLRADGRAGNAASGTTVAGCVGGLCIRDLSSRWMGQLAAVDSGGIRSEENAGRGGDFLAGRIPGEAAEHGAGFLNRSLGGCFYLWDQRRPSELV